jgi:hypothetical protein
MQSFERSIFQDPLEVDEDYQHGALLRGMVESLYDRLALADAYKLAGDMLVRHAMSEAEPYELVYPVLFNYRHGLELYLKILVESEKTHNFAHLTNQLESYVKHKYRQELPRWFIKRLRDFHEFDHKGTAFRYDDVKIRKIDSEYDSEYDELWIDFPYLLNVMEEIQIIFHRLIKASKNPT